MPTRLKLSQGKTYFAGASNHADAIRLKIISINIYLFIGKSKSNMN